jgi:hypothetical protein
MSAQLADPSWWQEEQAPTGKPMSAPPPKNSENRCLLSFLASLMTRFSYSFFQLPVPTSRKPLNPAIPLGKVQDGMHLQKHGISTPILL